MINIKDTLGEKAYQALKEKVSTLSRGTYLSARQFASEIGMSYTPVREAFLRLQREGTLKQIPNVGFFVETMDLTEMMQSFQVRECIEPFILQKVFSRITPEHISQMRALIDEQHKALEAGKIMNYMKADIALHEILLVLYGNPYLKNLYHTIREKYMFCSNRIAVAYYPDALTEHSQLVDSIENGDLGEAFRLTLIHIESARQRMRDGYINVVE